MFGAVRKIVAIFVICTLTLGNALPVYANSFQDISGYWAEDAITRLAALGIAKGYQGSYMPNAQVTRAEFTAMIIRALGLGGQADIMNNSAPGFTDVNKNYWASGVINIAKETGIITGYPDNSFRPTDYITRDEITSIIVRALSLTWENQSNDPLNVFHDSMDIPLWARDAIRTGYSYQLISGYPDGFFYPRKNATRGETAVLIQKLLEQQGNQATLHGTVESVDKTNSKITLNIAGQSDTYNLKKGLTVRYEGETISITKIKTGNYINVIVDTNGEIAYIEKLNYTFAPVQSQATSSDGPLAKSLTETSLTKTVSKSVMQRSQRGTILNFSSQTIAGSQDSINVIITVKSDMTNQLAIYIKNHGGLIQRIFPEVNCLRANVSQSLLKDLEVNPTVIDVMKDTVFQNQSLKDTTVNEAVSDSETTSNPGKSLMVTKQAIKAPEFVGVSHADGKKQIVAVIDTGVDPGHPDLQTTSGKLDKIVEWRDFTGEGDVDTVSKVTNQKGKITLANGTYNVSSIKTVSGTIHYGYIRETDLVNPNGKNGYDMNFNGSTTDIFTVILVDSSVKGTYDTVYVDTNDNKSFTDETPLQLYSKKHVFASFSGNQGQDRLDFVLTDIRANAASVNLGFDGNDHGTHVAGIIGANGTVKGVAPGAQIMSLKVMDSAGYGKMSNITDAMIYAASHGAKIINLSLGFPANDNNGSSVPAQLLNNLTQKYGVVFVTAAGNDGPGMNSVNTPGDANAALSVGAFSTPEMWSTDYGWKVPKPNLWFFSSAGPRKDGAVAPSVVAPGAVVSTVPLRGGEQYFLSEGTSIAAPHVAGALALLMEVADRNNLKVSPVAIKRAIESGATPIDNYSSAEQGYGALNLAMSWAELLALNNATQLKTGSYSTTEQDTTGVVLKSGQPGRISLKIINNTSANRKLQFKNAPDWYTPSQDTINVPSGKTRTLDFDLHIPSQKGLFSAFITGDDTSTYGKDVEALTTVINPYYLDSQNGYSAKITDKAEAAQYKRYFFSVPPGTDTLKLNLSVPSTQGRVKLFLFDPTGNMDGETKNFAGDNPDTSLDSVSYDAKKVKAGIWECVVYSSAALSSFGLSESKYNLSVEAQGTNIDSYQKAERNIIIGVLPKVIVKDAKDFIAIHALNKYTKKAYNGYLEVNGSIYYMNNGCLVIPIRTNGSTYHITVGNVPEVATEKPYEFNFDLYCN